MSSNTIRGGGSPFGQERTPSEEHNANQPVRPGPLQPLFSRLTTLAGVGPKRAAALARACGGERLVDLLFDLPRGVIDRRFSPPLDAAPEGAVITATVRIGEIQAGRSRRAPVRVDAVGEDGRLTLLYFHMRAERVAKLLPPGETRTVSGRVDRRDGDLVMAHPDRIWRTPPQDDAELVEPVYALVEGLTRRPRAEAGVQALARVPDLAEWLRPDLVRQRDWPAWRAALNAAHAPRAAQDLEPTAAPRARLAYDELLAHQLALKIVRQARRRRGRAMAGDGAALERLRAALPFALTGAQERAVAAIIADLASPERMGRLLMGDVGSGKTAVAAFAAVFAASAGLQTGFMAPTEVLARQHAATLGALLEAVGLKLAVLTGRDKGKEREALEARIGSGDVDMIVGTHALFQTKTRFARLGLVIVDEQHRFGVAQRAALRDKGEDVDLLAMTATPIPRSLALTAYGDLDVSRLDEKPPGRKRVETILVNATRMNEVVDALGRAVAAGDQAYWVCPFVEDTADGDTRAAESRLETLRMALGDRARIGLVHGRMTGADKDAAVQAFKTGDLDILVATTVIEVGVDAPSATLIIVEAAERFGLAQLHQLRGRVGRGDKPARCLLLYAPPLGESAKARLRILKESDDGFRIAEEDLRLRGPGDPLGFRQTGLAVFRLADPAAHADLITLADQDAEMIVRDDPKLEKDRGRALRALLALLERRAAVDLIRAG